MIALAQRDDGYLHTPAQIRARPGEPHGEPVQNSLDFEAYNLGHLMTAGCAHHRATGKKNLLKIALKAADYLVATSRTDMTRVRSARAGSSPGSATTSEGIAP